MGANSNGVSSGLISTLARHKVAPNLLMIVMLLLGYIALMKINVQFFPSLNISYVRVQVTWPGANAQDVETSITTPIERALRNLDKVIEITSNAENGATAIGIKFEEGTNMVEATDLVRQKVEHLRSLPEDSEKPNITRAVFYEGVARLLIISEGGDLKELRSLANRYEIELLDAGVDKISFNGLPDKEMSIQLPQHMLEIYELTLGDITEQIRNMSKDLPAGSIGDDGGVRDVRATQQAKTVTDYSKIPVVVSENEKVFLGDIAQINL